MIEYNCWRLVSTISRELAYTKSSLRRLSGHSISKLITHIYAYELLFPVATAVNMWALWLVSKWIPFESVVMWTEIKVNTCGSILVC